MRSSKFFVHVRFRSFLAIFRLKPPKAEIVTNERVGDNRWDSGEVEPSLSDVSESRKVMFR